MSKSDRTAFLILALVAAVVALVILVAVMRANFETTRSQTADALADRALTIEAQMRATQNARPGG